MTWLKHIGFQWICRLLLVVLAASGTISRAQELVNYPFKESKLAAQQEAIYRTVKSTSSNPLFNDYDVKFYGLDVYVDNRSDRIRGSTTILVEVRKSAFSTLVFELNHSLSVDRVLVDGEEMSFTHTGD